jgi:malonyl-CoA O-methyltransferase
VTVLSARDGYRAWAPDYSPETAISFLEESLVREFGVTTAGRSVLDAGCGTGRRLAGSDASPAVGIDLSPEMLGDANGSRMLGAADVRLLPFRDATFDVVWCRLVIGHLREMDSVYAELSRVCRSGGDVVVTDFHPEAAATGHRRTFRDSTGVLREIEHYVHAPESHADAASRSGLVPAARRDGEVGPFIRHFYADAAKLAVYDSQLGQRVVLALAYRKA